MKPTNTVPLKILREKIEKYTPEVDSIHYSDKYPYKYYVVVDGRRIYFGHSDYEDYNIHKDKERRKRYRLRHQHDKINYVTPGRYSWYLLW